MQLRRFYLVLWCPHTITAGIFYQMRQQISNYGAIKGGRHVNSLFVTSWWNLTATSVNKKQQQNLEQILSAPHLRSISDSRPHMTAFSGDTMGSGLVWYHHDWICADSFGKTSGPYLVQGLKYQIKPLSTIANHAHYVKFKVNARAWDLCASEHELIFRIPGVKSCYGNWNLTIVHSCLAHHLCSKKKKKKDWEQLTRSV